MKQFLLLFFSLGLFSCSEKIITPSFIDFKVENDSIYVFAKNTLTCPLYVKTVDRKTDNPIYKQLDRNSEALILKYRNGAMDSLTILNSYRFSAYYGDLTVKSYDTSYNYKWPFLKGYSSKIIQGYDGDFSHKGKFSSKTLDFDMNVGDTITASRDGVVVKMMIDKYKQGTTEDYKGDGNYIMIYHDDNTFSQYVHLKQYGNLVNAGDSIQAGQPIALSGFTGWTTLPHLHFGVYKPTETGLESIPIIMDAIPAKTLKRGDIIIKK